MFTTENFLIVIGMMVIAALITLTRARDDESTEEAVPVRVEKFGRPRPEVPYYLARHCD